ncbi:MAG: MBL fold metallo-hydrolase [Phycisphaerales bacterium]|nr:MBL fold metallo-hydrolase [Phycisphaerales bacterium]
MEVLSGVHQIAVDYHGRALKLYLLLGEGERGGAMLMDCGDATVPESDILPYFEKIGFDPKNLTYVLATHPDLDHTGGLLRMKQAAKGGGATFVCGTADREQVESPEGLADLRYRAHRYWHEMGMDDRAREKFVAPGGLAGGYVPMDVTFVGGEKLRMGKDRYVEILHLPGHSHGHLGVYLPWANAAIIGDAVHGTANRFQDGRSAFACTYMYIDEYLGTIDRLQAMKLDRLFSCHWADCNDQNAVNAFLNESRNYALSAERAILETVKKAGTAGITLCEVCTAAKPRLGDWPPERDGETRSMACGHLQHLVGQGILRVTNTPPVRYMYEPIWKGLR